MLVLTGQCFDRLRETQFIVLNHHCCWTGRVSEREEDCAQLTVESIQAAYIVYKYITLL